MSRLLVVDDEANIRLLYSEELKDEGYEVETAGTTAEAVEKLSGQSYDLVVLDIKLKNESGIELLQKIVSKPSIRFLHARIKSDFYGFTLIL